MGHSRNIHLQYFHDIQVNISRNGLRSKPITEGGAGEKVFMYVTDQILDYLIHVIVHHRQSFTSRCTEPLQHKRYLIFYLFV